MKPGTLLRMWNGQGFNVWRVTSVCHGAIGQENLIGIESVSHHQGTAYGGLVQEMMVPEILLKHLEVMP